MKVALIFPNNLFRGPHLDFYLDLFDDSSQYDIFNWDRAGRNERDCISFESKTESKNIWLLSLDFYKFKGFIKKRVNPKDYERVIVFSCQIAILLSDILIKKFSNRYLIDIRDYTRVIPFFRVRLRRVLRKANLICISSKGFTFWLPKNNEYLISHNISPKKRAENLEGKDFFKNIQINVATIGFLRDHKVNSKVIYALKNHKAFFMNFIGEGYALPILKKQALHHKVSNIEFHGYYDKKVEMTLLENCDFVNILVGNDLASKTLTTNRLYFCALLKIPAIVNSNTEQSRIIEKYSMGIICDDYLNLSEQLLTYRSNFKKDLFISECDRFLNDVYKDEHIFETKVKTFLKV